MTKMVAESLQEYREKQMNEGLLGMAASYLFKKLSPDPAKVKELLEKIKKDKALSDKIIKEVKPKIAPEVLKQFSSVENTIKTLQNSNEEIPVQLAAALEPVTNESVVYEAVNAKKLIINLSSVALAIGAAVLFAKDPQAAQVATLSGYSVGAVVCAVLSLCGFGAASTVPAK